MAAAPDAHATSGATYDSAEETLQEEMQRSRARAVAAHNHNARLRVIRRRAPGQDAPAHGAPHAAKAANPAASPHGYTPHPGMGGMGGMNGTHGTHGTSGTSGAAFGQGMRTAAGHSNSSAQRPHLHNAASPQRMSMFPSTIFWADKMQTLGAVYLVAEALVRTMLMESEEFADRVAWIALERLVRDTMAVRGAGGAGEAGRHTATRTAVLVDVRRMLGEIRATHAAFHTAIDYTLIHGAILVLLRVTHLASLSAEYAASPYGHTLARHVQELVFLCDFAGMVLGNITLTDAPHHERLAEIRPDAPAIWLPAHYANEALVRALAPLDARPAGTEAFPSPAVAHTAAKMLSDNASAVSNEWLARNLLRMSIGYKMLAHAWEEQKAPAAALTASPEASADADSLAAAEKARPAALALAADAAINEILRERTAAIQTWTQRHGSETGAVFMDPLYRIEEEMQPRRK